MPVLSLDDGIIKQNNGIFLEGYSDVVRDGQYRLQVSQFKNIADFKFTSSANMRYWEDLNDFGTGNTTFNTDLNIATITANASSQRYIQTEYNTHVIPPYNYRFWFGCRLVSFTDGAARFGYWNGERGIYLELSATAVPSINIQNDATATLISIPRTSWDDPLDGTGDSGITLDATLPQHYFLEYSWCGGYARFGVLVEGIPRFAHTEYFGNNTSYPEVQIGNPNLPMRFEVEGGTGDQSLDVYFATVQADIGENSIGVNRVATRGHLANTVLTVDKSGSNADEYFSAVAIRLNPTEAVDQLTIVKPTRVSLCCTSGANMHWKLVLITDPAFFSGTLTWVDIDESSVQYALAPDTTTYPAHTNAGLYGETLADGYFSNNLDSTLEVLDDNLSRLYRRNNGQNYELHLLVTTVNSGAEEFVYGTINFKELL